MFVTCPSFGEDGSPPELRKAAWGMKQIWPENVHQPSPTELEAVIASTVFSSKGQNSSIICLCLMRRRVFTVRRL